MRRLLMVAVTASLLSAGCTCCRQCRPGGGGNQACAHCRCAICRMNQYNIGPLGCNGRCAAPFCLNCPEDYVTDVDRAAVRETARVMARRNLRRIVRQESGPLSLHFCGGFEQAYVDLAEGLSLETPPPRRGLFSLLSRDGICSQEFGDGYRMGAAMAANDGFQEAYSTRQNPDDQTFEDPFSGYRKARGRGRRSRRS